MSRSFAVTWLRTRLAQLRSTSPEKTARLTVSVSEGGWDAYPAAIASRPLNGSAGAPTKRIVASDVMRGAGLAVEAHVEGMPGMLPPGLDLSAYRIVQEALTNALKHAGHTSATVRVAYQPDRLLLDITNQPGTIARTRVNGGHGIIGMRQRAALFGGSMKAEPQPGGGYKVQAAIPLEATAKTHVTQVVAKLGLRDRLQAVVYAYESGLVRPGGQARSADRN